MVCLDYLLWKMLNLMYAYPCMSRLPVYDYYYHYCVYYIAHMAFQRHQMLKIESDDWHQKDMYI